MAALGRIVCRLLEQHRKSFVVIEEDPRLVEGLRARGITDVSGDAGLPSVLDRAHPRSARSLVLCIPDRMTVRRALEYAREVNAAAMVLARAHHDEDRIFLEEHGAHEAVVGELELGRRSLERFKVDPGAVDESLAAVRRSVME